VPITAYQHCVMFGTFLHTVLVALDALAAVPTVTTQCTYYHFPVMFIWHIHNECRHCVI